MPKHVEPSSADGAACSAPVPDGVRRQVPDVVPSDADVAACLRVLDALAARPAAFQSPAHRDLRAATRRARDALAQTDFGGGDGLAYGRRRQLRKEREARQSQQAARDRRHRDTTALRRGRIERLRELTERNGRLALAAAAVPLAPDGAAHVAEGAAAEAGRELHAATQCYSCKARFSNLHHFYASLCPTCAALNWRMRHASASLEGRVALVTGARVKIGFEIGCKLLRAGATLVATTRFPADALDRYARLDDFEAFRHRLVVHAVDLRDLRGVEAFCAFLDSTLDRLDVVVNNACQTVRRPAAYYRGLADRERAARAALAAPGASSAAVPWHAAADAAPASELSQLRVAPEDSESALGDALPAGAVDVNGQQLDNRTRNSWTLKLRDVSAPEVVEAMAINAVAPFILNARLQRLLAVAAAAAGQAFVVNVSAMEGKFYRHKTPNHPHTNMAKAALNMMTRTSAADLARSNVYMTAVDTGWINDEKPTALAFDHAKAHDFQTPLDEVDAAARILDPAIAPLRRLEAGDPLDAPYGVFLKDYAVCEW